MTTIGYATLDIIPSFKDLRGEIERGTSGPLRDAGTRGGTQFGDSAGKSAGSRFGSIFSAAAKAALVGAGVGAGVAFKVGKDSIREASDLGESLNAVNVTFGKQARGVKRLGRESANSLGLSNSAFNGLAVQYSAFAKTIGGDKKTVKTLDDLTTRAADFASVMNLEVAESAGLFQSGLAGETEPLRRFGIDLSAAAVESYAYANGIAEAGEKLTEGEKVQARYASLMEQTSKTQGDFANTSDSLANRQRVLSARWDDARAKLGQGLLPIMEDAAGFLLDKGIPAFERFSDWFVEDGLPGIKDFREQIRPLADQLIPAMGSALEVARDALADAVPYAKDVVEAFNSLPEGVKKGLLLTGGAYAASKVLGGGQEGGVPSLGPGGLVTATKGALVTKSGEFLADKLLAKFQKPLPVLVVNPGYGAGDGVGGNDSERRRNGRGGVGGGKGFGALAGAAMASVFIPQLEAGLKGNDVTDKAAEYGRRTNEFFVGLKDAFTSTRDTDAAPATFNRLGSDGSQGINGNDLDAVRSVVLEKKLAGLQSQAGVFGETLDLIGKKKVDPSLTIRGMDKADRDLQKFLAKQIEARNPITPYVALTGYDRVMAQLANMKSEIHAVATAGIDNGIPFASGGGTSAGVVNNFNGPINATDTKDITRQAQRRAQQRGLGGRP